MIQRKSYRNLTTATMSEQARQLSDASRSYGERRHGVSRDRIPSFYGPSSKGRRLRPPTMLEYAKYVLKLRLLTSEKDKLAPLREKIIQIMSSRYSISSVFFIPYYRYSKKHNRVLYGLMLAYWFGDRKYRKVPSAYILKENHEKGVIDSVADALLEIPDDYLFQSLVGQNMALPTVLMEYLREKSETETQ